MIDQSAKSNRLEKALSFKENAVYLDQYTDKGKVIMVYYVHGYFVEVITDVGIIIDVMPYLKGRNFNAIKAQRQSAKRP
jgi:hypothetical protein